MKSSRSLTIKEREDQAKGQDVVVLRKDSHCCDTLYCLRLTCIVLMMVIVNDLISDMSTRQSLSVPLLQRPGNFPAKVDTLRRSPVANPKTLGHSLVAPELRMNLTVFG